METPSIPKTQESSHVEITNDDIPLTPVRITLNLFHKTKQLTKLIMWKY